MNKHLTIVLFAFLLMFALTGCGMISGFDGATPTVVKPSQADAELYQQIAVPFANYYKAEAETLPSDSITSYDDALKTWSTTGSTWEVYNTIAFPYVTYLHNDKTLSPDSVEIRTDTVLAWKIFLENTSGPAPENVFDPKLFTATLSPTNP